MFEQSFHSKFKTIFDQLNPRQRKAVETIEGPVLALAGPGTGKTHVLTTRIAHILNSTDTEAQHILCLTFTDAGVLSMRQKLVDLMGSIAHKVPIYTFHSFCNKVIQENIEHFGNHSLKAISSLERLELIRSIIDSLDQNNPLRKHQSLPYFYEQHLGNLFQTIKKENWSESLLINKIDAFLADLPLREEMLYKRNSGIFKKGDVKLGALEKISLKVELLISAIPLYEQYQNLMAKNEFFDFEDMILWVVNAFEDKPLLLRQYQEQFLYLMVDEFQDTNASQSTIIKQLMAYWGDNPNLFIVGDDDQSIYEFQGARLKNLTDLMERYHKNLEIIQLNQNYRSSQLILDLAKKSIDHNKIRVSEQTTSNTKVKYLKASNAAVANLENTVCIAEHSNQWQEEVALIQAIEQHQADGVPLKNVAILYAKHKQAQGIISLLDNKGIPYQIKKKRNILELPLMYNLRKLLRYLVQSFKYNRVQDEVLYELLHLNFLEIDSHSIAKMARWMRTERSEGRFDTLWIDLIVKEELLINIGVKNPSKILRFSTFIYAFKSKIHNLTLLNLIEFLIHNSGLSQFLFRQKNRINQLKVINSFLEFVKDNFEKNHRIKLVDLLDKIDLMQANRLSLNMLEVHTMQQGVQLMTAHSAKGLEFDYVYLMDVTEKTWGLGKANNSDFYYPDTLTFSNESDALEARRRLFYVALTRARKFLQISYSLQNKKAKSQQKLGFLDELKGLESALIYKKEQLTIDENWQQLLLSDHQIGLVQQESKAYIDVLLEDFKLSISALNSYLHCATSFYFEYILQLPRQKSEDALIGDCWHRCIQQVFIYREQFDKFPTISWVRNLYKVEYNRVKYLLNSNINIASASQNQFVAYYKANRLSWEKVHNQHKIITEKAIWNATCENVPIRGIVDKIELNTTSNSIKIVDYKYSRYTKKKFSVAKKDTQIGGSYWRQLYFYKLLLDGSGLYTQRVENAAIDFLQTDSKGSFKQQEIVFEPEGLERMKSIVKDSYLAIKNQAFDKGCGKDSCNWCSFVKNNEHLGSFKQPLIDELDDCL